MKKSYSYLIATVLMGWSLQASAQKKYVDEVFTDADIEVTSNVTYATNIDFLTSKLTDPMRIVQDLTAIKTALAMQQPIPATYYNPLDTTSKVKVTDIKMDVYAPKTSVDTTKARPVIIYLHTGNFLPPGINGSPLGYKTDSTAIYLCRQWAKMGYVAISADYRLGWNPLATTVQERRGQLLNAVYRSIQDVKRCVITIRTDAASANTYKIDPNKIALYGEGTGAYIAMAYTTLDKYTEMELPKFINPLNAKSYIDTANVGLIDGSGGMLNLYPKATAATKVSATVAAGGALADTSWLEKGDAAMIALQCIRDPFAPFDEGTVVVPTTLEDVVDVQGANVYVMKAVSLGNNDAFKNMPNDDIYTKIAREKYGKTFDYIYPAPRNTITVNNNLEGLFAVDLAAGASLFQNQAGPWQWWDPNSAAAKSAVAPGVTAHMASLGSNPDMSPAKGMTWLDTIQGYVMPRLAIVFGYYTTNDFVGVKDIASIDAKVYPNPANDALNISAIKGSIQKVTIRDLNGRVVFDATGLSNQLTLDISGLMNGFYSMEIQTSEGTAQNKIQVLH
ncbi:MAG: T9SS type A sorting domain-containing protein [Bacteroidetes bacterium]|nr:T9SS type A sorting domain-containing protein [Bacteroidota bacterium]